MTTNNRPEQALHFDMKDEQGNMLRLLLKSAIKVTQPGTYPVGVIGAYYTSKGGVPPPDQTQIDAKRFAERIETVLLAWYSQRFNAESAFSYLASVLREEAGIELPSHTLTQKPDKP